MEGLSVFISYSTDDKVSAGKLKKYLYTYCGFNCFLAHEDILISQEWEAKIIESLNVSDIFIPLISEYSKNSIYVNQEIGLALAYKKPILPLKLSKIYPFGFISRVQAMNLFSTDHQFIITITLQIFLSLVADVRFNYLKNKAINSVIYALSQSDSFQSSRIIMRLLIELLHMEKTSFSNLQIQNINSVINANSQVKNELYVLPKLISCLNKCG